MNDEVQSVLPADLAQAEIKACLSIILEGNAVDPESAAEELPRSIAMAVKRVAGAIVGVGAIKRIRPHYASIIASKSGFPFDPNLHELGYVAVTQKSRNLGFSNEITAKLLSTFKYRPLFATTPHEGMKRALSKAGFVRYGNEWQGNHGNLTLWINGLDSSARH
jgi:hypothetical protein